MSDRTCPICLSAVEARAHTLTCDHQFHVECLEELRAPTCPVCRRAITNLSPAALSEIAGRMADDSAQGASAPEEDDELRDERFAAWTRVLAWELQRGAFAEN